MTNKNEANAKGIIPLTKITIAKTKIANKNFVIGFISSNFIASAHFNNEAFQFF